MFDLPLPVPARTLYRDLDVAPDASDEEVRWAKAEAVRRLEAEKSTILKDLGRVRGQIPGLGPTLDEVASLRAAGTDADEAALAKALARLADLERQATARDPAYRQKCERVDTLTRRVEDLNRRAIEKPEARVAYDRCHPPLALLRLSDCTTDAFRDPHDALFLLRRDLAAFLESRGEVAFHPSDLTRQDFSADFTPNPLLDKEPHRG